MVHVLFCSSCWLLCVDSSGAGGGGTSVERESGVARAMSLTRGATREQHTPRHPDSDRTRTSDPGCRLIWDVFLKHATYVVSCDMSPTLPTKLCNTYIHHRYNK